jgi:pilus assembly protein TadC
MVTNDENKTNGRFDVNSKFLRVFLTILAVFLIFAGPTYISYLLSDILKVNYVASAVSGLALFIIGLLLMLFLIQKKIFT